MGMFGSASAYTPTLNALARYAPITAPRYTGGSDPVPNAVQQQARTWHQTPADRARGMLGSVFRATGQLPSEARSTAEWATAFSPVGAVEGANDGLLATKRGVENGSIKQTLGGVLQTALNAAPGGSSKAMFLGVLAKNADRAALGRAEQMLSKGLDRKAIWDETGWFKGVDNKWRFEIDDSASKLGKLDEVKMKRGVETSQILKHPELYDQHPSIAEIPTKVRYDIPGYHAVYAPDGTIGLDASSMGGRAKADTHSTLLHEIQHGVQDREGFANGGNLFTTVADPIKAVSDRRVAMFDSGVTKPIDDWYNGPEGWRKGAKYNEPPETLRTPQIEEFLRLTSEEDELRRLGAQGYRQLAGEVEARNVQKRQGMTPDQRRASPPWATQDVPDDQQIVRFKK